MAYVIPFQFRQLLFNLIGNALKFAKPDSALHIAITCNQVKGSEVADLPLDPEKSYHHLRMADNGIGFEEKYNERIFEAFQQLHGKEAYSGTGIGLAIVKKIVENHHGFICPSSQPDQGATFDIYLPNDQE